MFFFSFLFITNICFIEIYCFNSICIFSILNEQPLIRAAMLLLYLSTKALGLLNFFRVRLSRS